MEWFIKAAEALQGHGDQRRLGDDHTHEYESKVLAKAFSEITGIKLTHDLIQEGDVVEKIQTQMQSGKNIYDGWINDSDLIGTHFRYKQAVQPDGLDGRRGQGRHHRRRSTWRTSSASPSPPRRTASSTSCPTSSSPTSTGSATTGSPTRTSRPSSRPSTATSWAFRSTGRPTRTSPTSSPTTSARSTASRSTATWTTARRTRRSAGASPTPGSRWPATATRACRTACRSTSGASAWRAAARSAPRSTAAATPTARPPSTPSTKYLEWLKKYAPPQAQGMTFGEAGPVPAQGNIAQQIFWYTAFTADMVKPGLPVMNADGTPKWRMAPSPHGSYWKDGMKLGYQDAGSWHAAEVDPGRPPQGGLALPAVHHLEDRQPEEEPCRPHLHPRERHLGQELHRPRAPARRPDRVLPLAGARAVDPDGQQRAGLSEAGSALVAEHRRRLLGRQDPAGGDGLPGRRAGFGAGASREVRRAGRMRSEAQPEDLRGSSGSRRPRRTAPSRRSPSSPTRSRRARRSTTTR